ncbi:MFS transporter [Amycolatopsis taiwanensis]|uniref:MFS transporter n=1 Tax=Amycolatopsis taiwanensis TaxID=342230 RepID=UPI003CCC4199
MTPSYWRWSAGVQLARLPATMAPLAFTLLATAITGSYRLGGVLMSVFVVAGLLGSIPAGRLLDRIGPSRGLRLLLMSSAAGFTALLTVSDGPLVLALVVIPGAIEGGLNGGFRTLLAGTVPDGQLPRAVAVDAMILEGVLIAGPVLVSLLGMGGSLLPLAGMATACVLSALLVPSREHRRTARADRPALPIRAALPWLACQFAIGHLLSTIEVAPLPLVERLGAPAALAGLVIAVLSGSSIVGSALYAWRGSRLKPGLFLGGFVLGGVTVAADLGWPGLIAGAMLIGLSVGPLVTTASVAMQRLLPEGRRAEGFSVSFAVQGAGFALGSLAVGVLPLWLAPLLGSVSSAAAFALLKSVQQEKDEGVSAVRPQLGTGAPAATGGQQNRDRRR